MHAICPNVWRELSTKMCAYFVQLYLRNDSIKQNNPIAKGPLYLHEQTEFEAILITPTESLNPVGYQTLQYWHGASARFQYIFYHREML